MKAKDKLTEQEQIDLRRVFCDGCEADISGTSWSHEEYVVLTTASKVPWYTLEARNQYGGVMYPEARGSALGRDYHFCNLTCLDAWRGHGDA